MTFPIAVGTGPRHSSSRPFPTISRGHVNSVDVDNGHNDGAAGASQDDIIMAMGTNADETLNATVFICYHFLPITDDANIRGSSTTLNIQPNEDVGGHFNDGFDSIQQQPFQEENIDTQYNVIAELRVQITPATAPFVSGMDGMSSRETKSRVPLGIMKKRRDDHMILNQTYYAPNVSVEFSSNETYLACLIPLPISYELVVPTSGPGNDDTDDAAISTMVIFRIKAQRYTSQQHKKQQQKQHRLPKLPGYITEKTDDEIKTNVELDNDNMNSLERRDSFGVEEHNSSTIDSSSSRSRRKFMSYVAHEPKIVRALHALNEAAPAANSTKKRGKNLPKSSFLRQLSGGSSVGSSSMQSPSLQCATCMCNVPADRYRGKSSSAFSLLLVGTADGKLLFVDFALAKVRCFAMGSSSTSNPIVHLSQCTPTQWKPFDIYGEEQGSVSKGRIATVMRDGSVSIYTTSFVATPVHRKDLSSGPSAMSNLVGNRIAARNTTMDVDPIDGDRIIETKHTRLEMRIELLSTYSASTSCSKATSSLRYIHAKWLNPLLLVLLTRSPYLDDSYLQGNTNNAIVMSTEVEVAQIWTVAEILQKKNSDVSKGNRSGWSDSSESSADIALVSELKVPVGDNLDEFVHDTFSLAQQKPSSNMNAECVRNALVFLECARGMAVFHHRGTDTLAINSQVVTRSSPSYSGSNLTVRPFCLIWDWKRNIPGLTFASSKAYHLYNQHNSESEMKGIPSLFSWFQLGDDEDDGLCAMHVHEQDASGIARHIRKNIFSLSTLSPLNRFAEEGTLSLNDPSAILLNRDSVTFPFLGRPSISQDILLQWEESRVPSTYVATNGPCKIAAIGKESGHSIAVAASRGLCVLDLSRMPWMEQHDGHEKITPCANGQMNPSSIPQSPRWKQFSNVNDEQRFRVVSMDWWERSNCEDLLLATVQFVDSDSLNLVCWSRKSLGFGDDQLLKDLSGEPAMGEADEDASSHGVALPHGFRVHSMSIIKDSSNRALLLLSFVSHDDGTCLEYAVIQLHAIQSPGSKDELVLARISVRGNIPMQLGQSPDFYSPESVNGVFLAGGSFLFDLNTEMKDQEAFALIGIVTLFQGLVAVCVNQSGLVLYRPSLLENDCVDSQGFISSYWASGMMSSQNGCRMAWNIAKSDGKVFCWSVPCRNAESDPHSSLELNGNHRSAPFLLESHSILGDICNNLGRSSLWLNGSSTSEREMAMGPFGPSECILYAGQRSRKFTSLPESTTMKAFHVSNCIVAPPRFAPFLYISFLILSSSSSKHHELARDHIESTLRRAKSLGSCTSALRVLVLKVIEILDGSKSVNNMSSTDIAADQGGVSDETRHRMQKWAVGKAMLCEIVAVVETLYDKLGFATFFLSVCRQLEPHQFNLIFPLPSKKNSPVSQTLQTAEDLFVGSCEYGSLATALSALPLFSCHEESQESVTKLVYHCLIKIGENFQSCSSFTGLTQAEDEIYLHQLYWFGVKLEDAIEMERSMQRCDESFCKIDADCGEQSFDESQSSSEDYSSDDPSQSSSSTSTYEESSIEQDPDDFVSVSAEGDDSTLETYSSEDTNEISFLTPCRTPRRKPRVGIVKKVVKKLFSSSDEQGEKTGVEEDAIHAAASSFILSGFDGIDIQKLPCTPLPEVQEENNNDADDKSRDKEEDAVVLDSSYTSPEDVLIPSTVAGAVCLFVENAIANIRSELPSNSGWKSVSAVAHLIQGDRETIAITSVGSSNAKNISRMTTANDILARASPCDDLRQISDDDQQPFKVIASMLDRLTTDCRKQIHSQALDAVFNLVLLLLLRHDSCNDVKLCRATLISVGIVSGHLSGRVGELLDFDLSEASCDINKIYCHYEAMNNTTSPA